ncbi:hypothetical protein [Sphaerisporangium rhizosphaerae]|uniref:Resolvase/invertase-type recombinase catalytic domain-containing protein n=1 Tax=Sphaerisporangium rhizosphaerae TaxID=2269375 RepID=A0ABW2P0M5_9ACTN
MSRISVLAVEAHIYRSEMGGRPQRGVRDDCLRRMVPDLVAMGVARLVIESCNQDRQDRQVVREMAGKAQAVDRFEYLHGRPAVEPLLWLPDIVAWAYGKGGDWRRRTGSIVQKVTDVGL